MTVERLGYEGVGVFFCLFTLYICSWDFSRCRWPPPFEITATLLIQSFYLTKHLSGTSFPEVWAMDISYHLLTVCGPVTLLEGN